MTECELPFTLVVKQQGDACDSHVPQRLWQCYVQYHHIDRADVERQQLKTQDRKWDMAYRISLAKDWQTARLHTCDRKRSVVGLTEIFPGFLPWLFFTKGLSGACKSNLTLVSPTHNARYLLKCKHAVTVTNSRSRSIRNRKHQTDKEMWQLTANPDLEVYLKSIFCQFPAIKRGNVMVKSV